MLLHQHVNPRLESTYCMRISLSFFISSVHFVFFLSPFFQISPSSSNVSFCSWFLSLFFLPLYFLFHSLFSYFFLFLFFKSSISAHPPWAVGDFFFFYVYFIIYLFIYFSFEFQNINFLFYFLQLTHQYFLIDIIYIHINI